MVNNQGLEEGPASRPTSRAWPGAMASTAQQIGGAVGLAVLVAIANSTFTGTYLDAAKADVASGLRLAGIIGGAMLIVSGFLALAIKKQRAPGGTAETIEAGEQEVPARALS